jgi:hypothetical protein
MQQPLLLLLSVGCCRPVAAAIKLYSRRCLAYTLRTLRHSCFIGWGPDAGRIVIREASRERRGGWSGHRSTVLLAAQAQPNQACDLFVVDVVASASRGGGLCCSSCGCWPFGSIAMPAAVIVAAAVVLSAR